MLLLVDQAVANFAMHRLVVVYGKQVEIYELGLGEHQLYIALSATEVRATHGAVEQVLTVADVKNLHVNEAGIFVKLISHHSSNYIFGSRQIGDVKVKTGIS